jgi:hypothetical protein
MLDYHYVSKEYIQNYLNEFMLNRKDELKSNIFKVLENFMCLKPCYL